MSGPAERRWWRMPAAGTVAGERVAIWLMTGFLAVWLAVMVAIQFGLVVHHDGLGVTKQNRIPDELVEEAGVGNDFEAIMEATNQPRPTP